MRRSLTKQLQDLTLLNGEAQKRAVQTVYRESVMYLLQDDPFYGRVLSQLGLQMTTGKYPLALRATSTDWQLAISAPALATAHWQGRQWLAMLRHSVLHLLWQHPQRYAVALGSQQSANLVRWATDAAVNDYLTDLPSTAITSATLERLTGQPVVPRQDSAVYWRQLRQWQAHHGTTHNRQTAPNFSEDSAYRWATEPQGGELDDHRSWQTGQAAGETTREQWRQQLFSQTAAELSAKQRGTLPGAISAALTIKPAEHPLNWQGLLQRYLGQVPAGRKPAYGRFNRRMPQRMELPGQRVQTWQGILIFIDESGSMGQQEIGYLLGQLSRLLAMYPVPVKIYPFDTVVHVKAAQTVNGAVTAAKRVGGGGTRFQAIFDALPALAPNAVGQLVIILTDGYGEKQVTLKSDVDVLWLLTSPRSAFSVHHAAGRVISLAEDPAWQALKETLT